jgi:hypothetical protein
MKRGAKLIGERALTNAERQARFRARRDADIERLRKAAEEQGGRGREAELEAALASERATRRDLEVKLAYERTRRLAADKGKGPKPDRPPVDPESELGRAKAKIAELQARLRAVVKERDAHHYGAGLSKATLNTIRRALHADQAAHSTAESREAALAALNADLERQKRSRR